jgi:hypothetical protein
MTTIGTWAACGRMIPDIAWVSRIQTAPSPAASKARVNSEAMPVHSEDPKDFEAQKDFERQPVVISPSHSPAGKIPAAGIAHSEASKLEA